MMKFKTITTMMMTAVMVLALVGCGSSESTTSSTKATAQDTKAASEIVKGSQYADAAKVSQWLKDIQAVQ